jgi:hypothetical protein
LSAEGTGFSVALASAVVVSDKVCAVQRDGMPAVSTVMIAAFRKMLVMFTSRFLAEINEYVYVQMQGRNNLASLSSYLKRLFVSNP